jgi:DNA-binding MarR family transcriptional regulator
LAAFRTINRATSRALLPFGLSAEQAHILLVLWLDGPTKVGELQRTLALSSGTLTGALDRMDKAGLIKRVPDPIDRRSFRVQPAPYDARRRRAVERTLEDVEQQAFLALDRKERRQLFSLLSRLAVE